MGVPGTVKKQATNRAHLKKLCLTGTIRKRTDREGRLERPLFLV